MIKCMEEHTLAWRLHGMRLSVWQWIRLHQGAWHSRASAGCQPKGAAAYPSIWRRTQDLEHSNILCTHGRGEHAGQQQVEPSVRCSHVQPQNECSRLASRNAAHHTLLA